MFSGAGKKKLAHVAAIVVVLLAGALSASWAFIVPIFQAPDEPAHFDYAISIYSAGRLVRASDGPIGWIVSPYTEYLMSATQFDRVMEHSSMRVGNGYGTTAFFKRLDASAPALTNRCAPSGVNYIVPVYPFGFYAAEAAVMALASRTDSLSTVFYSGRLLCVVFTMAGLYFSYRVALNLGLTPWRSVALIAALGCFPLTTLVASYIQPDNLAFATVSLALWVGTEMRSAGLTIARAVALGGALGLLALTKYHFLLAVAPPVAALLVARVWLARPKTPNRFLFVGVALIPAIALSVAALWISAGSVVGHSVGLLHHVVSGTAGPDPRALVQYIAGSTTKAFTDFFVTGQNSATYWGVLGWVDTPLVIVNETVELLARVVISILSVTTFLLLAYIVLRNVVRMFRTFRRHMAMTMSVALGDVAFNSYACFVLIMFTLYVATDNAFGAEGRQWYPFILPTFLCFVWYAPRALGRLRGLAMTCTTALLLCYAVTAAFYALGDVVTRYYGPPIAKYELRQVKHGTPVSGVVIGKIWPIDTTAYHVGGSLPPTAFAVGTQLHVIGIAILPEGIPARRVSVVLDGSVPLATLTGQYNYLVAEATRSVRLGFSQFEAVIDTAKLKPGRHTVAAYVGLDNRHYQEIFPVQLFYASRRGAGIIARSITAGVPTCQRQVEVDALRLNLNGETG